MGEDLPLYPLERIIDRLGVARQFNCHFLIGRALQVETEGIRLQLGESRSEGEDQALELLCRNDANGGVVDVRPRERVAEGALAVGFLAGRGVAEGDVGIQGRVLEPGRRLDRRDDLARDAELREAPEGGLLVCPEVANRLVEPDQALLDEVLRVAAGKEVRAGLEPDEARVAADQDVEGAAVAVAGAEDELEVFELSLGLLRSGCAGRAAILASPGVRGETISLTLRLRQKIARSAGLYKTFALDPGCYEHMFGSVPERFLRHRPSGPRRRFGAAAGFKSASIPPGLRRAAPSTARR